MKTLSFTVQRLSENFLSAQQMLFPSSDYLQQFQGNLGKFSLPPDIEYLHLSQYSHQYPQLSSLQDLDADDKFLSN